MAGLAAPISGAVAQSTGRNRGPRVVVIGAGAFGGWTALHLGRRQLNVPGWSLARFAGPVREEEKWS